MTSDPARLAALVAPASPVVLDEAVRARMRPILRHALSRGIAVADTCTAGPADVPPDRLPVPQVAEEAAQYIAALRSACPVLAAAPTPLQDALAAAVWSALEVGFDARRTALRATGTRRVPAMAPGGWAALAGPLPPHAVRAEASVDPVTLGAAGAWLARQVEVALDGIVHLTSVLVEHDVACG